MDKHHLNDRQGEIHRTRAEPYLEMQSSKSVESLPGKAECTETGSTQTRGTIIRSADELYWHPAYAELELAVLPIQIAALKCLGDLAFKDPLLVTRQGIIIDGYARKAYADMLGVLTLACVELDIGEEDEALHMILSKHRRSPGWNDYNRIRMALRLRDSLRTEAHSNQQAGGHFKGRSKLTEANVRKKVAAAAGVSEGNVTKAEQLCNSDPAVLKALAAGEIRIHRAWRWRGLTHQEQREELRLYRLNRTLKQPVRAKALKHRANESDEVSWVPFPNSNLLEQILQKLRSKSDSSETIAIGKAKLPGKIVLLSTELFTDLVGGGDAH